MLDLSKKDQLVNRRTKSFMEKDQIEWYHRNSRRNFMIGHHNIICSWKHTLFSTTYELHPFVFSRPLEFLERIRMHELAEGTLHPFECAQSWLVMVQLSQVPWSFFLSLSSFGVHWNLVFWHSATKPDTWDCGIYLKKPIWWCCSVRLLGLALRTELWVSTFPKTTLKLEIQLRCCCSLSILWHFFLISWYFLLPFVWSFRTGCCNVYKSLHIIRVLLQYLATSAQYLGSALHLLICTYVLLL